MKLTTRQKALIIFNILAFLFIGWQLYSMFFSSDTEMAPTPKPSVPQHTYKQPKAQQQPVLPSPAPATTLQPQKKPVNTLATTPLNKKNGSIYTKMMRQYGKLQTKKILIQQKLAIAEAKQDVVNLNKKLAKLTSTETQTPAISSIVTTKTTITRFPYRLMYVDYQDGEWSAIISYRGKTIEVKKHSKLPGNARIVSISSRSLLLRYKGELIKVTFHGYSKLKVKKHIYKPTPFKYPKVLTIIKPAKILKKKAQQKTKKTPVRIKHISKKALLVGLKPTPQIQPKKKTRPLPKKIVITKPKNSSNVNYQIKKKSGLLIIKPIFKKQAVHSTKPATTFNVQDTPPAMNFQVKKSAQTPPVQPQINTPSFTIQKHVAPAPIAAPAIKPQLKKPATTFNVQDTPPAINFQVKKSAQTPPVQPQIKTPSFTIQKHAAPAPIAAPAPAIKPQLKKPATTFNVQDTPPAMNFQVKKSAQTPPAQPQIKTPSFSVQSTLSSNAAPVIKKKLKKPTATFNVQNTPPAMNYQVRSSTQIPSISPITTPRPRFRVQNRTTPQSYQVRSTARKYPSRFKIQSNIIPIAAPTGRRQQRKPTATFKVQSTPPAMNYQVRSSTQTPSVRPVTTPRPRFRVQNRTMKTYRVKKTTKKYPVKKRSATSRFKMQSSIIPIAAPTRARQQKRSVPHFSIQKTPTSINYRIRKITKPSHLIVRSTSTRRKYARVSRIKPIKPKTNFNVRNTPPTINYQLRQAPQPTLPQTRPYRLKPTYKTKKVRKPVVKKRVVKKPVVKRRKAPTIVKLKPKNQQRKPQTRTYDGPVYFSPRPAPSNRVYHLNPAD